MYSIRQSAALMWGKLRRSYLVNFRQKRVEEKLERRRGACTRCGACCKLLFNCPAYDESNGEPKCLVYNDRPGVCGLFPLDEKDLRERNFVMPGKKCGFYFSDEPKINGNGNGNGQGPGSGPIRMSMPQRWGPPKKGSSDDIGTGNGKPRWMKGSMAILWAYFRKPNANGNGDGNGNGNGTH